MSDNDLSDDAVDVLIGAIEDNLEEAEAGAAGAGVPDSGK